MEQTAIKRVLAYIEAHLKEDTQLHNQALASVAGYSEYHFLRLFCKVVRLTPQNYIRKRRISEIVKRIGENRPISDIAFEYGFNSKENFTRAFKKEHSILPTAFKATNCSLCLFEPFLFADTEPNPAVSLQFLPAFTLLAYPLREDPPCGWNRYNSERRSTLLSGGRVVEDFGAMQWNEQRGCLEYFIGIRENDAHGDTVGTVRLEISEGLYAVFETMRASQHDFVVTIRRTWDWIYSDWLPASGYRRRDGFELESYTETSRNYSEKIYVPVMRGKDEDYNGRNYQSF